MVKPMTTKKTRVQLELPEKSMERLKRLKDRTEAASYADVVKNAFLLMEHLVSLKDEGKTLTAVDKKTGVSEELLLLVPHA